MAAPKLRIDALQTVIPARMTDPGRARRVAVAAPLRPELLQSHLRIVLYYKRAHEEESAQKAAAWIKETLNAVLPEHPVLAGRLRREHEQDGYWEVKANDAGVRLVQATMETTMSELLGAKDRDAREAQLAYWLDVDGEDPNFSALFFIQVTEFQGDGYSIGISCSVLLADPLFLTRFLKKCASVHKQLVAQGQLSKASMFHLAYFKRPGRPIHVTSNPPAAAVAATTTTTMLYKVPRAAAHCAAAYDALASRCLGEVSRKLEGSTVSDFLLLVSDPAGDLKVESCCKKDMVFDGALDVAWWDELGMEEMVPGQGNKPVHVSYYMVSPTDKGLVVAMLPSDGDEKGVSGLLISVTVPRMI